MTDPLPPKPRASKPPVRKKKALDYFHPEGLSLEELRQSDNTTDPAFLCDCMLGGLAKWLRAAGYDALWQYHAEDSDLVRLAESRGLVFATSDAKIMERRVIRQGSLRAVFVPRGLSATQMLEYVAAHFALKRAEARCMACGGRLLVLTKEQVKDKAPPKAYARCDRFFLCARCGKLFWNGTHWTKITRCLDAVFGEGRM
jgi:hypothetical protein